MQMVSIYFSNLLEWKMNLIRLQKKWLVVWHMVLLRSKWEFHYVKKDTTISLPFLFYSDDWLYIAIFKNQQMIKLSCVTTNMIKFLMFHHCFYNKMKQYNWLCSRGAHYIVDLHGWFSKARLLSKIELAIQAELARRGKS